MKIKARHVKMARAAARYYPTWWKIHRLRYPVENAVLRWHRAAKGKHQ